MPLIDNENPTISLAITDYPKLDGVDQGQNIKLELSGKIQGIEGNNVVIRIESSKIDLGNSADKEYEELTGKDEPKEEESKDSDPTKELEI